MLRSIFIAIACGSVVAAAAALGAEARTHGAGSSAVPRIVAGALPAVVSVTTRQIERDQFKQPIPTRGLGSGCIISRSPSATDGPSRARAAAPIASTTSPSSLPILHNLIRKEER